MEVFDEAAVRHYKDGGYLVDASRLENGDQLFGLAAECAIKEALSYSISKGTLAKLPHVHVDEGLWEMASLQLEPKRFPGLAALLKAANPFHDWAISQRYQGAGCVSKDTAERHRAAARRVIGAVGLLAK